MDSLRKILVLLSFLFLFSAGCASLSSRSILQPPGPPSECQEILETLDKKIEAAGVSNAAYFRIPGFPYLRANRFWAFWGQRVKEDRERDIWVQGMKDLSLQSWKAEIWNLPEEEIRTLSGKMTGEIGRQGVFSRIAVCSEKLLEQDREKKGFYTQVRDHAKIPDEYSTFLRVIGLHPITGIAVAVVTENAREKVKPWFEGDVKNLSTMGLLKTYAPRDGAFLDPVQVQHMMREAGKNPSSVPRLEGGREETLARAFAPVIIQDAAETFDAIGGMGWKGDRVEIFPEKPTAYYYFENSFLNEQAILQINYVIWYGERGGKNAPWFERGHLDGLTIRFSLDPQGRLFMVDVMNNCGCYHFFAPDPKRVNQILAPSSSTPPFVPQNLPVLKKEDRLGLRVNSGWHQVQHLLGVREPTDPVPYELVPYRVLESLPQGDGRQRSIFDSEGIIPGTERIERFFLFPMGVPHVGSMRQRGHHAIDFIGRAHFDDPDLFNRNFILK
jgi:hypothetical protein